MSTSTTTSSSSAPARAAARSPTGSRRRASASCCSSAAATCRASPRTGISREVFGNERYMTSEQWFDKDGTAFRPHAAVLRRRQHQVLRRDPVPAARARLRRGPPLRRRLAGVADLLRRPRALLRRGRAALPRPRRGGRGPDRAAALRARSPTRRHPTSRASSSCTTTLERTGHHPFHLPVGVDLNETDPEAGRCVRCDRFDGFPCLADGKADAHVRCVRPALRTRQRHPAHARTVERSRPTPPGRRSREVVVERRGERGALLRRRRRGVVRRRQLGRAAAALGQRRPSQRPGQLVRRRRAPLHGAHQLGA